MDKSQNIFFSLCYESLTGLKCLFRSLSEIVENTGPVDDCRINADLKKTKTGCQQSVHSKNKQKRCGQVLFFHKASVEKMLKDQQILPLSVCTEKPEK